MHNQEKEFLDDTGVDTSFRKPKKQLSEQKSQHLQNLRVKALEKKKQMKEITEKANKLKEIESLKEAKKIQKEQLAKRYDEMIEKQKVDLSLCRCSAPILRLWGANGVGCIPGDSSFGFGTATPLTGLAAVSAAVGEYETYLKSFPFGLTVGWPKLLNNSKYFVRNGDGIQNCW